MSKWGKFDFSEFEKLLKQLKNVQKDMDSFYTEFILKIALRAVAKIKMKTPVDNGLLRNSWAVGDESIVLKFDSAGKDIKDNKASIGPTIKSVTKNNGVYIVTIYNNVEYAPYIEYGHRIMSKGEQVGFVKGKFMMTLSMKEIEQQLPKYLKNDFQKWLNKRVDK